jgi:hypothetical protein
MFYVPEGVQEDAVSGFAKHAAPPIDTLGKDEINGWVTGRHLLDRNITEEHARVAGYLRLTLMKAQRKIPPPLLRAEVRMAELAEMEAQGVPFLKRQVRSEIKKSVIDRLLPTMPPHLTGVPIVDDHHGDILYAGAMSEKQVDALTYFFQRATGSAAVPLTPGAAALKRRKVNARDLGPTSFSPEYDDGKASDSLGQDFLTWLWFFSEARGGILSLPGLGEFGVIIEGPLMFVLEGEGAHVTVLRNGEPLYSAEAKTSLLSGKKLRRARVTLARGEESWSVTLDAEEFVFRGLKLPKGDELDPVSRFQERMLAIETFREAILSTFDRFLEERADPARWKTTREDVHKWVAARRTRM